MKLMKALKQNQSKFKGIKLPKWEDCKRITPQEAEKFLYLLTQKPMTNLNRKSIEQLIDSLSSKELTFGCLVAVREEALEDLRTKDLRAGFAQNLWIISDIQGECAKLKNFYERRIGFGSWAGFGLLTSLGYPVLIGDMIERIIKKFDNDDNVIYAGTSLPTSQLIQFWWDASGYDLGKSLQELASEIEWQDGLHDDGCDEENGEHVCKVYFTKVPKPSPQADLFKFLLSLNLVE